MRPECQLDPNVCFLEGMRSAPDCLLRLLSFAICGLGRRGNVSSCGETGVQLGFRLHTAGMHALACRDCVHARTTETSVRMAAKRLTLCAHWQSFLPVACQQAVVLQQVMWQSSYGACL